MREAFWWGLDVQDFPLMCHGEVEDKVLSPTHTRPSSAVGVPEEPHEMAMFSICELMLEETAKMIRPWNNIEDVRIKGRG